PSIGLYAPLASAPALLPSEQSFPLPMPTAPSPPAAYPANAKPQRDIRSSCWSLHPPRHSARSPPGCVPAGADRATGRALLLFLRRSSPLVFFQPLCLSSFSSF